MFRLNLDFMHNLLHRRRTLARVAAVIAGLIVLVTGAGAAALGAVSDEQPFAHETDAGAASWPSTKGARC